jgi:membrane protease YdiL (CAAX protease family)
MIFTYGLSWLFWVPTALFGQDVQATAWGIPFLLGGFGPSAAGVILTHRYANKLERREFCRRAVSFRRISLGWYLFIFLIFPALFALSLAVNAMLGRPMPPFETLATIAERPVALVGLLIIGIIAGPISEELGWRGYAQDRLQMSWSVLVSTLILAVFWWGWHLPLFFIDGATQQAWGF